LDFAAVGGARVAALAVPIVEKLPAGRMLHTLNSPPRRPFRDKSVSLSSTRIPENSCDGVTVQRPCRARPDGRLCRVNVKLTMRLQRPQTPLVFSHRVARLFSRFPARRKQVASNRLVRSRGGVGMPPAPQTEDQSDQREGVLSTLPLFFLRFRALRSSRRATSCFAAARTRERDFAIVHLHRGGKDAYLGLLLIRRRQ